MDIEAWLRGLGLERHAEMFRANDLGLDVLPDLTDADLAALGLSLGDRKRLLRAIAALRGPFFEPSSSTLADTQSPAPPRLQAERRQLTVMFVDLVGSTALSARLDPEEMRETIHAYQNTVADKIARFEGHVAKFMGDGVLAYFGWPRAHEDEAERAVRAGLAVVEAVGGLCAPDASALAARVGIATGTVVVGDLIGRGSAAEEAVVGETPNLGARLQELAPPGGVVVAESTRRLLGRLFEIDELGTRTLKGFSEPVRCFRVVGESGAEGRFEAMHGERVSPLVGRDHEIGLLLDRFARAREGDGQVVLLAGEPGLGKSRLVRALRNRLAADPYTPLTHHCSPYHVNTPLWPVIGLLERAAGLARDDSTEDKLRKLEVLLAPHGRDLGEATALLGPLLGLSTAESDPPPDLAPDRRKERTQEVLLDQVQGLAAERPVLCVYEDAHWMDPSTVELVGLVVERVQRLPVLVVVTFRPEFTPPWPHHAHVTQLSLARLTRRHAAAMVDHLTGGKALPPEVLRPIAERTDGVPLFVEELTKAVLESGLLRDAGDRFTLAGSLPPLAIPATLQDSLVARLDRLGPVKEVAQLGAAIGREFTYELLAAVATTTEPALREALAELVAAELVFCRGRLPQATYVFKHALVQDAAYQSLLKSRRVQVHARIGEAIEQRFPGLGETQPELVAHHLTEAGIVDRAIDYWRRAGQLALARCAMTEAIAQLTKGLELLPRLPDGIERRRREVGLQVALGQASLAAKGFAAAETGRAYARASELCRELGDSAELFPALYGQSVFHFQRGELVAAHEVALELLRLAEERGDAGARVTGHRMVASPLFQLGRLAESRVHYEAALALYDPVRDRTSALIYAIDSRVMCLSWLSQLLAILGDSEQALARSGEVPAYAHELAHPNTLAVALTWGCIFRQLLRDMQNAQAQAKEVMALATEQGFPLYLAAGKVVHGWALANSGRAEDGIAEIRRGLRDYGATGAEMWSPYFLGLLAEALGLAGQAAAGLSVAGDALDRVNRAGARWIEAHLHRLRGELLLGLPEPGQAEADACFGRALAIAREQGAKMWELRAATSLARLWCDQGRRAAAHDLLAPLYARFTEGLDTPDLVEAKVILDAG